MGRTGRKFPETSPAQARMQSTDGTGHGGRVRGVAERFRASSEISPKAPKTRPRIGPTAESRSSSGPFGERPMIERRGLERIFISGFV